LKIGLECIPCFVRQTFEAAGFVTDDERQKENILRQVLSTVANESFNKTPPYMGRVIHGIIRDLSGNGDPYLHIKKDSNLLAGNLLPSLRHIIGSSTEPFETAVRLAIAGNIIDYGQGNHISEEKIKETITSCLGQPINRVAVNELREEIKKASSILYLGDNAGEIFFDRLLIERIKKYPVTFAVRGRPIINDALREDASMAGIDLLVKVVDNGSDAPGTILEECSEEFRRRFAEADLVIAKGQGNYETLNDERKKIFFLLKAKCPVIARDIGCDEGDIVIVKNS
jgi:uncharacterized protein with ATP-grasp and redox domains